MDPRLRSAVDASAGWYEDVCALHGVASTVADGVWSSLGAPPPLHSDAVVLEPGVAAQTVLRRLEGREHAGVKDAFARLDLATAGMRPLFSATWIHREPAPASAAAGDDGWARVTTADQLARWTAQHDTSAVLLPGVLRRGHIAVLTRRQGARTVAGAVARLGSGVVDVSNTWAVAGHRLDRAELAAAVASLFPGRPLVGYERGAALEAALAGGFQPLGELTVWVR